MGIRKVRGFEVFFCCQSTCEQKKTSKPLTFLIPIPHHHGDTQRTGCTTHTQQIQALQNQLSTQSPSPPVDPPPPPTTTKLLKIAAPTPFTGLQDDLNRFKVEWCLYICL